MSVPETPADSNLWAKVRQWITVHPRWTLALAVLVCLGPFLSKPFNMDDPLFVWTAKQIQAHPGDPYGFDVNWYRTRQPMWVVMQNPPLAAYYLAGATAILGWSEFAAHLAFLLPALAVILGTYRLARLFCDRPLVAAAATLLTPVFLVSSTTVMCDTLMLAFWVWTMIFWIDGLERGSPGKIALAVCLAALAALTKYFAVCLVPLLAVYAWKSRRRWQTWVGWLVIPLLALGAYHWATQSLYQHDLLANAVDYASNKSGFLSGAKLDGILIAFSFTGGGLAVVLFFAPWWHWSARILLGLIVGVALVSAVVFSEGTLTQAYHWISGRARWSMDAQMIFWAINGASILALAAMDVWRRRDAFSWLLVLWIFGTFLFTALLNWTVNGRSILPMAPAVGILIARRWQQQGICLHHDIIPLAGAALLAILTARADFLLANAVRECAVQTKTRYAQEGRTIWFQGHWGFQYYLQELGGKAFDRRHPDFDDNDVLVIPLNNTNLDPPSQPKDGFPVQGPRWLTTLNLYVGAGFYGSPYGPLPFLFGHVPPENVAVYNLKSTAQK
jgi:4-amino-4-deoxy-L-arabinose transferase-like glycosyltransferase